MLRIIKWLGGAILAVICSVIVIMIQTSPEIATSNVPKWIAWVSDIEVPNWLIAPSADELVLWTGGLLILSGMAVIFRRKLVRLVKRRHGGELTFMPATQDEPGDEERAEEWMLLQDAAQEAARALYNSRTDQDVRSMADSVDRSAQDYYAELIATEQLVQLRGEESISGVEEDFTPVRSQDWYVTPSESMVSYRHDGRDVVYRKVKVSRDDLREFIEEYRDDDS